MRVPALGAGAMGEILRGGCATSIMRLLMPVRAARRCSKDVDNRCPTGIGLLTGAIIGAVDAPLHRAIYALVKGYESSLVVA